MGKIATTILILMLITTVGIFLSPIIFIIISGNFWFFALFLISWIPALAMFLLTTLVGSLMEDL